MAFDKYPVDLEEKDEEKYHQAVVKLMNILQSAEDDECWLPTVPLEDSGQTYFFGYKTAQLAALTLNGPIKDTKRKFSKVITLCPHEDCCNPAHMFLVNKRNNLVNSLVEMIGANTAEWVRVRDLVNKYERARVNKIKELEGKMATPGIPPNALKEAVRVHAELSRQVDWAFNNAIFAYMGKENTTSEEDKFFLYLNSQGLLTAYSELPKVWKDAISALLECPYKGRVFTYYNEILVFVAKASGATRLHERLRSLGLEVSDESYTV